MFHCVRGVMWEVRILAIEQDERIQTANVTGTQATNSPQKAIVAILKPSISTSLPANGGVIVPPITRNVKTLLETKPFVPILSGNPRNFFLDGIASMQGFQEATY
uniref:Putative vesicular amine transporter n=1 Tax=Ixodes ricinus TaxID=34613 RepID=A0A0K8RCS0_IXORI